jgi:hypothetical protein
MFGELGEVFIKIDRVVNAEDTYVPLRHTYITSRYT